MVNMPKKTKLYSRFLLLRIYPDSPVHTSAKTERIQLCPVTLHLHSDINGQEFICVIIYSLFLRINFYLD